MEAGRRRIHNLDEDGYDQTAIAVNTHYSEEISAAAFGPPPYIEESEDQESGDSNFDENLDEDDEIEKFSRGRSRSHSMHMNDDVPDTALVTSIDPNVFIAQGGYRGQGGGGEFAESSNFKGVDLVNRTGPLQEREVQALMKGLEEATPHRNPDELEEEAEEIRAAESEKRHRATAKVTAASVRVISEQDMRRVKILMLGDSGVGKTSLMLRWTTDAFNSNMVSTVGVNFKSRRICVDGEYIQVQVWDTAGQEHFHKITTSYYRGANAIILVYDLSDPRTMDNVHYWLSSIKEHASDSVHLALIGNKVDIRAEAFSPKTSSSSSAAASSTDPTTPVSDLDYIRGLEWADKLGVKHFETSAKDSTNVDEAFMTVITSYLNSIDNKGKSAASSSSGAVAGAAAVSPGSGAGAGMGAELGVDVGSAGVSSAATSAASSSPMSPPLSPTTQHRERLKTIKKLKRSLFRTLGASKDKYAKSDAESKGDINLNHNSSQASMGGMSDPEGDDDEEDSGAAGGLNTKKDKEKCIVS